MPEQPTVSPSTASRRLSRQRSRMLIVAIAVVLLAIVAGVTWWVALRPATDRPAAASMSGVVVYNNTSRDHDNSFKDWTESPPTGGTHNNAWQSCGFYDQAIPNGRAVHSLEHGAVWITYRPDLPSDQIEALKALTVGNDYVLINPYADQSSPVVATSWNHQLLMPSADVGLLNEFIATYANKPTYTPEFGAPCSGGATDPA